MDAGVTGPHAFGDMPSVANRTALCSCLCVSHSRASVGGGFQNTAEGQCVPNTTLAHPPTRLLAAQVVVWTPPILTRLLLVRVWTIAILAGPLASTIHRCVLWMWESLVRMRLVICQVLLTEPFWGRVFAFHTVGRALVAAKKIRLTESASPIQHWHTLLLVCWQHKLLCGPPILTRLFSRSCVDVDCHYCWPARCPGPLGCFMDVGVISVRAFDSVKSVRR